ncbi:MAG: DUF192 domain-containing protein [Deltaproteobacteria bacterium]|nr:DUF192 domain-containing protein [Deltaproteobacteria bacterium]
MKPHIIFFASLLLITCKNTEPYQPPQQQKQQTAPKPIIINKAQKNLPRKVIHIYPTAGRKISLEVQVAATELQKQKGLMFRKKLPQGEGMLFVYRQEQELGFYMANCYIHLDMIFLDKNKKIVDIIRNAKPMDKTVLVPRQSSQYVIEVNGGFCKNHNIQINDLVKWR